MSSRSIKSKSDTSLSSTLKGKQRKSGSSSPLKRLRDSSGSGSKVFGRKKSGPGEGFKPVAKIPSSRAECSGNWKALLKTQGKQSSVSVSSGRGSSSTATSSKKNMDSAQEMRRARNSIDSEGESVSTERSRSISDARCDSQLSMASESASSIGTEGSSDASLGACALESNTPRKVKQEFRALGLSESAASQQNRQSRTHEKTPRGQHHPNPRVGQERKLKACLPQGLNEFGYFDYSHYGACRTPVTPAHAEFMTDSGIVAMDCEMVGVGPMRESALARVSIVNKHGFCLYDRFVKPKLEVTDYRTQFTPPFQVVVREVAEFLRSHILVGHSLKSDLAVLYLNHPKARMRDTAFYFKKMMHCRTPKLKTLVKKILGVDIQQGEHSSITDAQATMALYLLYQKDWEISVRQSNRGIDVFKICMDEFKELQLSRSEANVPPPALLHAQPSPSTSQYSDKWYGFPDESCFYDVSNHPQELGQLVGVGNAMSMYSGEMPVDPHQFSYPVVSTASPLTFMPPFVESEEYQHMHQPPPPQFMPMDNNLFYQQPAPITVPVHQQFHNQGPVAVPMSGFHHNGFPYMGIQPGQPQQQLSQFIPQSAPRTPFTQTALYRIAMSF